MDQVLSKILLDEWVARHPPTAAYRDAAQYLQGLFDHMKAQLASFSYKEFGELLGFAAGSTYVHLALNAKRRLSPRALSTIAAALGLSAGDRRVFLALGYLGRARTTEERRQILGELEQLAPAPGQSRLRRDQHRYHEQWYHVALRELVAMPGFRADPRWIARRLRPRITAAEARRALDTLVRLELVVRDEASGAWQVTHQQVTTGDDVRSIYVRTFHRRMMQLAADSLDTVPAAEREVSALTLGVDAATATALKERVRAFRKEIVALVAAAPPGDRVVQLNLQLFPLTEAEDHGDEA